MITAKTWDAFASLISSVNSFCMCILLNVQALEEKLHDPSSVLLHAVSSAETFAFSSYVFSKTLGHATPRNKRIPSF